MKIYSHLLPVLLALLLARPVSVPEPLPDPGQTVITEIAPETEVSPEMLPPVAWRFRTITTAGGTNSVTFKQQLHAPNMVVIQVLENGNPLPQEIHNPGTNLETFTLNFSSSSAIEVQILTCSDDVQRIDIRGQGITELYVDALTGLERLDAQWAKDTNGDDIYNDITNPQDLTNCNSLQYVDFTKNLNLQTVLLDGLALLQNVTLTDCDITHGYDLNTNPSIENFAVSNNNIPNIDLGINNDKFRRIVANNNEISNTLDFSAYCPNMEYIWLDRNFDLTDVRVDHLQHLELFRAVYCDITSVLNLYTCPVLNYVYLEGNTQLKNVTISQNGVGPLGLDFFNIDRCAVKGVMDLSIFESVRVIEVQGNEIEGLTLPDPIPSGLWRMFASSNKIPTSDLEAIVALFHHKEITNQDPEIVAPSNQIKGLAINQNDANKCISSIHMGYLTDLETLLTNDWDTDRLGNSTMIPIPTCP
ncbi:MAG: hypothetical protein AAF206_27005 [Bacteroidota bacterium]